MASAEHARRAERGRRSRSAFVTWPPHGYRPGAGSSLQRSGRARASATILTSNALEPAASRQRRGTRGLHSWSLNRPAFPASPACSRTVAGSRTATGAGSWRNAADIARHAARTAGGRRRCWSRTTSRSRRPRRAWPVRSRSGTRRRDRSEPSSAPSGPTGSGPDGARVGQRSRSRRRRLDTARNESLRGGPAGRRTPPAAQVAGRRAFTRPAGSRSSTRASSSVPVSHSMIQSPTCVRRSGSGTTANAAASRCAVAASNFRAACRHSSARSSARPLGDGLLPALGDALLPALRSPLLPCTPAPLPRTSRPPPRIPDGTPCPVPGTTAPPARVSPTPRPRARRTSRAIAWERFGVRPAPRLERGCPRRDVRRRAAVLRPPRGRSFRSGTLRLGEAPADGDPAASAAAP